MPVALEREDASPETSAGSGSRRSGGREARRALRAAPLAEDIRPVRPGLEGGSYQPLAQNDLERIHEAAKYVALEDLAPGRLKADDNTDFN